MSIVDELSNRRKAGAARYAAKYFRGNLRPEEWTIVHSAECLRSARTTCFACLPTFWMNQRWTALRRLAEREDVGPDVVLALVCGHLGERRQATPHDPDLCGLSEELTCEPCRSAWADAGDDPAREAEESLVHVARRAGMDIEELRQILSDYAARVPGGRLPR